MKKKILAALTAGILTTGLMTGGVFAADTEVKGDENLKGEVYAFIAASLSNSMEEIQKDFERWMVFQLSLPKIELLKKRMLEEAEKKGFERAIDKMLYKLRDHSEPSELYAFFSHMEEND